MDRRHFIGATAGLAVTALGAALPVRHPKAQAHAAGAQDGLRLFRFDETIPAFVPHLCNSRIGLDPQPVRLCIEGLHLAAGRGVLAALQVNALFGDGAATCWRSIVWRHRRGDLHGGSRACSFDIAPAAFRGLEFSYRPEPEAPVRNAVLDLHPDIGVALTPGRYVVLMAPEPMPMMRPLRFSGDWRRPLAQADTDYLRLKVTPPVVETDLSLRADLACLRMEAECAIPT